MLQRNMVGQTIKIWLKFSLKWKHCYKQKGCNKTVTTLGIFTVFCGAVDSIHLVIRTRNVILQLNLEIRLSSRKCFSSEIKML
jgi:transposase-like protein